MTGWIGISLGDITGIGAEVTLKSLAARPGGGAPNFLLLGDMARLSALNEQLGTGLELAPFDEYSEGRGLIRVFNPLPEPLPPHLAAGSPSAAHAALAWLKEGGERCLRQELDALVTAPVSKESILRTGTPFIGQTEFLSELAGTERTAMMLLGPDERGKWLRVALATTHLPLKYVAERLTQAKVELAIELAADACRKLGLPRQKVAVCGLNPHAGEGGELGTEEQSVVIPAVLAARNKGLDTHGPYPADALFYYVYAGEYDAVVAMYHDQGLVPLKMVAFENGINWTLGLPFIRTSPDHGTAYDIAGKGKANPSSMSAAIALAIQLSRAAG